MPDRTIFLGYTFGRNCKKNPLGRSPAGLKISSLQNARMALADHPDFLICQGIEAGGHVQGTAYLTDVLAEVVEVAGEVPVLASGGMSTGHNLRNALYQKAAGVMMGTRLMATSESDAHPHYKQRLVVAGKSSTV